MKRDEASRFAPLIQAYADGADIQVKDEPNTWRDLEEPCFNGASTRYRIKPKPVTRPWQSTKDFPKVGSLWLRGKEDCREHLVIGLANDVAFITASCGCSPVLVSSHVQDWRMDQHEWSEDRKTWHDCTVTEEA